MAKYDYLNNYLNTMTQYKSGGMMNRYDVGGTHEQNPNGGVPIGPDSTVEEGEASVNIDQEGNATHEPTGKKYIYSDRQMWSPAEIKAAGLPPIRGKAVTAAGYMKRLEDRFKDRSGAKDAQNTLQDFHKRAQGLAEQKRMAEQAQVNAAMQANSQQIAPENQEVPPGMEEYQEQPPQMFMGGNFSAPEAGNLTGGASGISSTMPNARVNFACGGMMKRYDVGGNWYDNNNPYFTPNPGQVTGPQNQMTAPAGESMMGNAAGGAGALSTAFDLYGAAKGNTTRNMGMSIAGNAAKGAMAGAAFGPIGMGVGALAGGIAGGIGAKKAEKNFQNELNSAISSANAGMPNAQAWSAYGGPIYLNKFRGNNSMAYGGPLGDTNVFKNMSTGGRIEPSIYEQAALYKPKQDIGWGYIPTEMFKSGGTIHIKPENRGKFNATKARTGKSTEELTHSSNPVTRKRAIFAQNAAKWHHAGGGFAYLNGGPEGEDPFNMFKPTNTMPQVGSAGINPNIPLISNINKGNDNAYWASQADKATSTQPTQDPLIDAWKQVGAGVGKYGKQAGQYLKNNAANLSRLAPVISNFLQRDAITKPTGTYYARLNDTFNVPQVDEATGMRDINQLYNTQRRAIGQMGGSQAQQRAMLTGLGGQQTEAVSKYAQSAAQQNRELALQKQQYQNAIAQYNAGATDRGTEAYRADIGNYDTQKSKFTGQIGTDLGEIGKEQLHMKQVAAMYGYAWDGKYMRHPKTGEIVTIPTQTPATTPATATVAYGGYIKRKPSKY